MLSNTAPLLPIRVELAKSFSFYVQLQDARGNAIDFGSSQLTLTVRKYDRNLTDLKDQTPIILDHVGSLSDDGRMKFQLQSSQLEQPGEYYYTITLIEQGGYSVAVAKGPFTIEANADLTALSYSYSVTPGGEDTLVVKADEKNTMVLAFMHQVFGGARVFTEEDYYRLYSLKQPSEPDWTAQPGDEGYIHNKPHLGEAATYSLQDLAAIFNSAPSPHVPPVLSVNGVTGAVQLDADTINESVDRKWLTAAERKKLQAFSADGRRLRWSAITEKPAFGTAATKDAGYFAVKAHKHPAEDITGVLTSDKLPRVTELRGISTGRGAPTGGQSGDIYIQIG